ncbi:MAG: tetratricopeptide repeat protein [Sediminibacterium sp.]|nr:tetratricopeptide repeat protein [Sediminibacterium sp.]
MSINLFSQNAITEKMLSEVSFEKRDSIKTKLYEEYFKGLSGENENLIIKFKKPALEIKPKNPRSEKQYAAILCMIGTAYKNIKEFDSCEKYQLAGLKVYKKLDDKKGISLAYNGLGVLEKNRNNFIKALEYYYAAIEPLDKEKDRGRYATIYMNIGIVYRNLKNPNRAIDYYNSCDSIYIILKDTSGIIRNNVNRCTALKELGKYDDAKKLGLYAEKLANLTKTQNNTVYNLYDIIAGIYLHEKNYSKAEEYYLRRLKFEEGLDNKTVLATIYESLALLYHQWGKKVLAEKYFNLAVKHYSNNKDSKNRMAILSLKIEFLKSGGSYKEALDLFERKYQLNDSIFSSDLTEKISKMENDISNQNRNKDLELLQKNQAIKDLEIKRQKFVNYGLLGLVLLIVVFVLFVLKNLKENKRINSELNIKNNKVEEQSTIIEQKNKDIIDSINYAQRLQQILLPAEEEFKRALPESFLFFEPKDIVSGDFYFIEKYDDRVFVAVVDCTGHGVPGAIMSMVANNILNKVVRERKIINPAKILEELNKELYFSLKQNVSEKTAYDGMDMSICVFYPNKMEIQFAAANTSVYIVNKTQLIELKPDKVGLGKSSYEANHKFNEQTIKLNKNDMVYMGSDGYADQFGGSRGKKMMKKNMQKLFLEIAHLSSKEQYKLINDNFVDWKGNLSQVDDVTVLGFRV